MIGSNKPLLFGTIILCLSIYFHSVSESMCTVQDSHCPFGFGRIIFHELRDYALMNALEESSLLEDVSLFDGLVTLINFLYYAHILKVTLDNFLLILRMMICLTLEFIRRSPMQFSFTHLTEAQFV